MRLHVACALLTFAAALVVTIITTQSARAQTFTSLYSFPGGTVGGNPYAGLVQGTDGNLYGTTEFYGNTTECLGSGCGTVFNITSSGTQNTLYSFCLQNGCADGSMPDATLVLGTDGNFYGTTFFGGLASSCTDSRGCGTVFRITPGGGLSILHNFCSQSKCVDGFDPISALALGSDGNFYGTTPYGGGGSACKYSTGCGTFYQITPAGTLTTLYNFCSQTNCTDGEGPTATPVQGTDGNFYGTTEAGGASCSCGTIFKITPTGTLTTLYRFGVQSNGSDGFDITGGLVQGSDGNFYGTTYGGGNINACAGYGCGTVFKITPGGTLSTLYTFCSQTNCADGSGPEYETLVLGTDGNFYGTTGAGGASSTCDSCGDGTIFEITSSGQETALYSFDGSQGSLPIAGLVQDTDGNFYGTANRGADPNCSCGTVFSESVGLGPFVKTLPTSGKVGSAVQILGTNLTGATSVSFNGTAATFAVTSASLITTTAPTGSTTGPVTVITPSGTLTSNLPFTIPAGGTSTTTLISSLNPSAFNQSVTFTATVIASDGGTPTGTVTFTADGSNVLGAVSLSSGQAAQSTSSLKAGSHSIVASYSGDNSYQPSASAALIQTVQMASSSLSIASDIDPSIYGQGVTFTASVTPQFGGKATGIVTFFNSANTIGGATVSGNKATLTYSALAVGTADIQASYSGDSNVAGSTSPVLFQVVKKATTTTAAISSLNPAFVGQTITFTATVTSQHQGAVSGTVDFKSGALSLGSAMLVNGQASIDASFSASGAHSITAKYLGDENNTGSTSPALKQAVNKYPSSTAIASSLNPSMVGQEVTFTATVTVTTNGSPTGTVTFKSGTTVLGNVPLTGNIASLSTSALTAGAHSIKAVYSGDGTFKGSTSPTLKQVVNKYSSSTAAVSSLNPSTVGQEVTFTATVTTSGSPTGTVTFKYGTTVLGTGSLTGNTASLSTSSLAAGSYNVNAVYSGDGTFKGSTSPVLKQVVN
jgi:uncharacterized repeat protein (TIGR03803 family)